MKKRLIVELEITAKMLDSAAKCNCHTCHMLLLKSPVIEETVKTLREKDA